MIGIMATATLIESELAGWARGTRLYSTSDGRYLAVEATNIEELAPHAVIEVGQGPLIDELLLKMGHTRSALKLVVRPTVVFLSDEQGQPVDSDENDHDPLTPLHRFPAGTSHAEALAAIGYTV